MADKNFVVKNGLIVNTSFVANSTKVALGAVNATSNGVEISVSQITIGNSSVNATINSTSFTGTANISSAYVQNTDSRTLSGNLTFSAANISFTSGWYVGANVSANASALFVGNSSVNTYITSSGLYVNGVIFPSGGGYYKGNQGSVGAASNANNLFRINSNTMSNNITIAAGENALTVGPITVGTGNTFTIQTGGRAVII